MYIYIYVYAEPGSLQVLHSFLGLHSSGQRFGMLFLGSSPSAPITMVTTVTSPSASSRAPLTSFLFQTSCVLPDVAVTWYRDSASYCSEYL